MGLAITMNLGPQSQVGSRKVGFSWRVFSKVGLVFFDVQCLDRLWGARVLLARAFVFRPRAPGPRLELVCGMIHFL